MISEYFKIFTGILIIDFLRYFIPASLAFLIFWKIFKRPLLHRFIQDNWPKTARLWSEFKYSMSTVLIFALIGVGIVTANNYGLTKMYFELDDYGRLYALLSLTIMILFHDAYFYWTHRLMHHPRLYKYIHRVHHQSINPSPWAAYSFHPFEAVIQALVFPIILFTMPVHPTMAFTFLIYMIVRNVWGHLGFELFPKNFISSNWINWHTTTTHHNQHHEKFNCNYGLYFTWWDKWFNTESKSYKSRFKEVTERLNKRVINKTICLLFICSNLSAQSPEGKWMTYDEKDGHPLSIIEIYKNAETNKWEGKIDSIILKPNQGKTPSCSLCKNKFKNKEVIGLEFLWGFSKENDTWVGGKIMNPEDGEIYTSKIWFIGENRLKVRGYGGPFDMFYQTQTWERSDGIGIEGDWFTINEKYNIPKSRVHLEIKNGQLFGTIEEIYLLPHEGNNPICVECQGELKDKAIVGMQIMSDFEKDENEWSGGSILDPGNGQTYQSKFTLPDDSTLQIRGYLGPFFRTQVWKRIQ